MWKDMKRPFIKIIKFFLYKFAFFRGIQSSISFKRSYKRYFGNMKFKGQYFQDIIAFL